MTQEELNTEKKILQAAKQVFQRKGMDGARMLEIAEEAGINKSLLHYYFRSKEKLFEAVFHDTVSQIFPLVKDVLLNDQPMEEKIKTFFEVHINFLMNNPILPNFMINELSRDPEKTITIFTQHVDEMYAEIHEKYGNNVNNTFIKKDMVAQIMISIVSLTVFPFLISPLIKSILKIDDAGFVQFMQQRKVIIPMLISKMLNSNNLGDNFPK